MIKEITLAQFKKHKLWKQKIDSKLVFIHGNNATGKTSILEAISLFTPGSGIFNNNLDELISFHCNSFEVKLDANFRTELSYASGKKEIKINETAKKPLEVLEYLRIYGLTPYLALAFWKDSTIRRKHIDRLIMQNDPLYPVFYAQYAKTLKERNKLLELGKFNSRWEQILHPIIIENGTKITEIRCNILKKITENLSQPLKEFLDPTAALSENSGLEIKIYPTLEEQISIFSRPLDPNFMGPHKTKFEFYTPSYSSNTASTAQQKKILLALTISALPNNNDTENILLLDDLFTTLDRDTMNHLLKILQSQTFQTFVTHMEDIDTSKILHQDIQKIQL